MVFSVHCCRTFGIVGRILLIVLLLPCSGHVELLRLLDRSEPVDRGDFDLDQVVELVVRPHKLLWVVGGLFVRDEQSAHRDDIQVVDEQVELLCFTACLIRLLLPWPGAELEVIKLEGKSTSDQLESGLVVNLSRRPEALLSWSERVSLLQED